MVRTDVLVKKSKIEGKGVFANGDFMKDEVVLKWDTSHELTKEQFQRLSEKDKKYINSSGEKLLLLQEPERYVNHSCDANTNVKHFSDVAIREIKKGEEITADYSLENIPCARYMKCNCGSKNCRKNIMG